MTAAGAAYIREMSAWAAVCAFTIHAEVATPKEIIHGLLAAQHVLDKAVVNAGILQELAAMPFEIEACSSSGP